MLRELRDWAEELACRAGLDGLPSGGRLAVVAVIVAAVLAAVWFARGAQASASGAPGATSGGGPTSAAASSSPVADGGSGAPAIAATVTVHVVGEVRHPGVYALAGGARAIDAIEAAGGLLGDADQNAVNLARVVADGEQIAVPKVGDSPPAGAAGGGAAGASGAVAGGKVDLNTATADQLDALPGVGPATAQKIIADRSSNGPFRTVEDLMRVSGIGPAKFDGLKDLVTVR